MPRSLSLRGICVITGRTSLSVPPQQIGHPRIGESHPKSIVHPVDGLTNRANSTPLTCRQEFMNLIIGELRWLAWSVVPRRASQHGVDPIRSIPLDPSLDRAIVDTHRFAHLAQSISLANHEQGLEALSAAVFALTSETSRQLQLGIRPAHVQRSSSSHACTLLKRIHGYMFLAIADAPTGAFPHSRQRDRFRTAHHAPGESLNTASEPIGTFPGRIAAPT